MERHLDKTERIVVLTEFGLMVVGLGLLVGAGILGLENLRAYLRRVSFNYHLIMLLSGGLGLLVTIAGLCGTMLFIGWLLHHFGSNSDVMNIPSLPTNIP